MTRSRRLLGTAALAVVAVAGSAPLARAETHVGDCVDDVACAGLHQDRPGPSGGQVSTNVAGVATTAGSVIVYQDRYACCDDHNRVEAEAAGQEVARVSQSEGDFTPVSTHVVAPGVSYSQTRDYYGTCTDSVTVAGHTESSACTVEVEMVQFMDDLGLGTVDLG